jgi:hypothetical protein
VALTNDERDRLSGQLETVSQGARRQQQTTYLFLGLLVVIVVGAGVAGVLIESNVFWGVAGGAVFTACACLIAYTGTRMGIFGQMVDLVRLNLERPPNAPATTSASSRDDADEELRRRVREAVADQPQEPAAEESAPPVTGKRSSRSRVAKTQSSEEKAVHPSEGRASEESRPGS